MDIVTAISGASDSIEEPECTACGYSLKGIISPNCPECGADVSSDPTFRYPSKTSSPWSATHARWLILGIIPMIWSPLKTLRGCASPRRVTERRAILFAVLVTTPTVALWPLARELGLLISVTISTRGSLFAPMWIDLFRTLTSPGRWREVWGWEAWSIARWWLLFGVLTFVLPASLPREQRLRRLMLFSSWIALLEFGFLVGVWFVRASAVPEPSTFFFSGSISIRQVLTNPFWLTRGILPTFVVGALFARGVLNWNWPAAFAMAVFLVPVSLVYSAWWSSIILSSGLLVWLYG